MVDKEIMLKSNIQTVLIHDICTYSREVLRLVVQ